MRPEWRKLAPPGLGRDSLTLILGWLLRIGLQGAYFVVVARSLGVEAYGAFSAVLAFCSFLIPFSSLGAGDLLIKHVRRDSSLASSQWKSAACVTGASGTALVLLFVFLGHWLAPASVSWLALLCLGLSDLILARLIEVAAQGYLAIGEARMAAVFPLWLMAMRLVAAGVLALAASHSSRRPGPCCTWQVSAPVALVYTPSGRYQAAAGELRGRMMSASAASGGRGSDFSVSVRPQGTHNDIDKGHARPVEHPGSNRDLHCRLPDRWTSPTPRLRSVFVCRLSRGLFDRPRMQGNRGGSRFTRRLA